MLKNFLFYIIFTVSIQFLCVPLMAQNSLSEQEEKEGFILMFNGKDLVSWEGDLKGYRAENGTIICSPGGRLWLKDQDYSNFIFRFDFKLTPGANNGVGIRCSRGGDPAYAGMEIQILDNYAPQYKNLKPYQFHGSVYGVVPAKQGVTKPAGEWNTEEIYADGAKIRVTVNGEVVVETDLSEITTTLDGKNHPGLHNKSGGIGFLGHGSRLEFRNIRVKRLPDIPSAESTQK